MAEGEYGEMSTETFSRICKFCKLEILDPADTLVFNSTETFAGKVYIRSFLAHRACYESL